MSIPVHSVDGQLLVDAKDLKSRGIRSYDPDLRNTVSNLSSISVLDGAKEKLFYRGVSVEDICDSKSFLETEFLILAGRFPNKRELARVKEQVAKLSVMDRKTQAGITSIIESFPQKSDPVSILSAVMSYLSSTDPLPIESRPDQVLACLKSIAYTPIITGLVLRHIAGGELKFPAKEDFGDKGKDYNYSRVFLHALSGNAPTSEEQERILETVFNLHLDAGLSPSSFAAQQNVSAKTNMWRGLIAAANSLSGSMHAGANTEVMRMYKEIASAKGATDRNVKTFLDKKVDARERVPGLGHIVFKFRDPRAVILECIAGQYCAGDEYQGIAKEMHRQVMEIPYFTQRNLNPNVDFYSGIVWKKLGIPDEGMTVAFFAARAPGLAAHILEAKGKENIIFPDQTYMGQTGLKAEDLMTPDSRRPSTEILPVMTKIIAIPKGRSRDVEL